MELIAGKTVRVDEGNRYFFGGKIEAENIKGWGYTRYMVSKLGPMAGTLIAVDPNAPKVNRFIAMGGEPYIMRHNSRLLPLVVYAPEGVEVLNRRTSGLFFLDATLPQPEYVDKECEKMLGDRGGFQKMVPYDGAARIPMIVAGPGVATGVCVTPVTTWDTAATVVEAAGLGFPDGHPSVGTSLRSIAADPPEGRIVVSQHGFGAGRWIMATDGTLKFIHWYNGDEEAYDLAHDPTEQINIAADIDVSELRSSCIAFERQHGSTDAVQDDCFVDDLTGTPHPQSHSLFPDWSSQQFPPWAISQVSNATELIVSEMNACKKARGAFVGNDPVWKQRAYECWESIHGERARYDELFQTYEKGSDQAPDCSPS